MAGEAEFGPHAIVAIGDRTTTNSLHATTREPVDFPAAPQFAA